MGSEDRVGVITVSSSAGKEGKEMVAACGGGSRD